MPLEEAAGEPRDFRSRACVSHSSHDIQPEITCWRRNVIYSLLWPILLSMKGLMYPNLGSQLGKVGPHVTMPYFDVHDPCP